MANKALWKDLSSEEENDNESPKKVEAKPEQEQTTIGRQFGKPYQPQQKKIPIQHRSEIEELIDNNRSDDVVLNIVKCHFDATEDDIRKTFPDFEFLEVENYNKGSFSLVFKTKDEAKRFVEATRTVKILERNFWVKFPTMHQKANKIEGTYIQHPKDINNRGLTEQERNSGKDYDSASKRPKGTYDRRKNDADSQFEGVTVKQSFFRGGYNASLRVDEKRGVRPERPEQPERQQRQERNERTQKPKEEDDDGWQTVGINQKPVDLKPKQYQNHGNKNYQHTNQQQRSNYNNNNNRRN